MASIKKGRRETRRRKFDVVVACVEEKEGRRKEEGQPTHYKCSELRAEFLSLCPKKALVQILFP